MTKQRVVPVFIFILSLFLSFCSPREQGLSSVTFGSGLDTKGHINGKSLSFNFSAGDGEMRTVRDLFNFIYFEGDTLCFSLELNRPVKKGEISVAFRAPGKEMLFPAERLEVKECQVWGFSLVGSLLENFYAASLTESLKGTAFQNKVIPFELIVALKTQKKPFILKGGAFSVDYR